MRSNLQSAGWKTCFVEATNGGSSTFNVSNLQGGRFGGVGMRDIKVVVNPDGTTYQPSSNLIYFAATVADPSGINLSHGGAYQGVFSLNLDNMAITETGVIASSRSSAVLLDQAGQIIYHSNGDREVLESAWGGPTLGVLYQYVTNGSQGDVLTTNLSILSSQSTLTLPLGGSGQAAYDPALVFDSANSRWLLAYTITNDSTFATASPISYYFPALASATTSPTGTWTLIGEDTAAVGNWEGTNLFNVSGNYYVLAGGPAWRIANSNIPSGNSSRVYDAAMTYQGAIQATFAGGGSASGTQPHPNLFQHPDGIHVGILTFDGTKFQPTNAAKTWGQPTIQYSVP